MKNFLTISILICCLKVQAIWTEEQVYISGLFSNAVMTGTNMTIPAYANGQLLGNMLTHNTSEFLTNGTLGNYALSNPTNFNVVYADAISGKQYTNNSGGSILVGQGFSLTYAGVTGSAKVNLVIQGILTNSIGKSTTIALTIGETVPAQLSITVTNGQIWYFTNIISGAGNAAAIVAGSGQLTYMKPQ